MGRPHTEFIQSQVLPWRRGLYGGAYPDVYHKVLSKDQDSGASSLLVRYPAGWKRTRAEYFDVDEEFYVLDGTLTINGNVYSKDTYAHLPRGYTRARASSRRGAVVLTFFSGVPAATSGKAPKGSCDERRLVERHNIYEVAWGDQKWLREIKEFNQQSVAYQLMREDPDTGERTWILGVGAFWEGGNVEIHPVVEESYMLSGSMVGTFGERRQGGYFWRPPGIKHGPLGSPMGSLIFFRCLGGPLDTEFLYEGTFEWTPKYRPILPKNMRRYAAKSPETARNY
jgi:hypothetical protein